jgi:hypothetical protein
MVRISVTSVFVVMIIQALYGNKSVRDHHKIDWCPVRWNNFIWGRGSAIYLPKFRLFSNLWHHTKNIIVMLPWNIVLMSDICFFSSFRGEGVHRDEIISSLGALINFEMIPYLISVGCKLVQISELVHCRHVSHDWACVPVLALPGHGWA